MCNHVDFVVFVGADFDWTGTVCIEPILRLDRIRPTQYETKD